MNLATRLPTWSILAPIASWAVLALTFALDRANASGWTELLVVMGLVAGILCAVFHAEVVAHRVGEPYGTLVLALAVTAIEVALIVSLMISGGESANGLARDAVFASVMIILNGMVGICLLSGGRRHGEQAFGLFGIQRHWPRWRPFLFSLWCYPITRRQPLARSTARVNSRSLRLFHLCCTALLS